MTDNHALQSVIGLVNITLPNQNMIKHLGLTEHLFRTWTTQIFSMHSQHFHSHHSQSAYTVTMAIHLAQSAYTFTMQSQHVKSAFAVSMGSHHSVSAFTGSPQN